jgi:hypothetical protein
MEPNLRPAVRALMIDPADRVLLVQPSSRTGSAGSSPAAVWSRARTTSALTADELRAEGVVAHRWWTVAELAATGEEVRPYNLGQLVAQVLEFGAPAAPLELTGPLDG